MGETDCIVFTPKDPAPPSITLMGFVIYSLHAFSFITPCNYLFDFLYDHPSSGISPLILVSNFVASTVQYLSSRPDRGWKTLIIPPMGSLVKPVCS